MIEIREYEDRSGRRPFSRWFNDLDDVVASRITVSVERLRNRNFAAKGVGSGVMELRLDFGPGYRVYFGRDGDTIVILLGGGTKRRQQSDIEAAMESWQEYKARKREG